MQLIIKNYKLSIITLFISLSISTLSASPIDSNFLNNMVRLSQTRGTVWKAYKNYVMIGLHNTWMNPKEKLTTAIDSFESDMKKIESYIDEHDFDKVTPVLLGIDRQWVSIKTILTSTPNASTINQLDKAAMKITRSTIKALKAMGTYDSSGNWNYIAKAQKAQNIAERMAVLYLDKTWGALDPKRYSKMMTKATGNFVKVQKLIKKSKFLDADIGKILNMANKNYLYFKFAFDNGSTLSIPTLIFKKSNSISSEMGEVTKLLIGKISKEITSKKH